MTLIDIDRIRLMLPLLDEVRFVAMCNDLLVEAALRAQIPRSAMSLTLNTKEGDGGIDAICTDAPHTVPRIIPLPNCDYQFKSGRSVRTVPTIVAKDILEQDDVVSGLCAGHAFVYMAAWDRATSIESDIRKGLKKRGLIVTADQIVFLGREQLAQILASFPSVVARYVGMESDTGILDVKAWAGLRRMVNPFVTDEGLAQRIAELRRRVEAPSSSIRIVGAAGDGKTRMVLEAVRDGDLSGSVLYAQQVAHVTPAMLAQLMRTTDVRCTLVIDEVDDLAAEAIESRLHGRPVGLRLVLIGLDASGRPQPETLQVEGLSRDLIARVITSIAAGIPAEVAASIAADCERSPKLAVLIAGRIRDEPALVRSTVLGDRRVQNALDQYLPIQRGDIAWDALAAMSLLMHTGWSAEHESESTLLFELVGLDPIKARKAIHALDERYGIAPIAGRYRYVSPAILADHLAAKELRDWTRDHMARVFAKMTPAMAESFGRRARRLSAILENAAIVEEVILGPQGPFRDLAEVEAAGTSAMLRQLAAPFPVPTLRALERLIHGATVDELIAATHVRRDLYWALEELLWPATTFESASELMLRLAIAENETWANNSTGTWVETFQMMLGRTAAGWQQRLRAIRVAANDEHPKARELAANAVRAAFKTGSLSRAGNPPRDFPNMPTEEWRPKTYGEWADALVAYLDVIDGLTRDPSPPVRLAVAECLGDAGTNIFHLMDRVAERWGESAKLLVGAEYEIRAAVLKPLEWALIRWTDRAEELEGKTQAAPDRGDPAVIRDRLRVIREVVTALSDDPSFRTEFRRRVARQYRSRRKDTTWQEATEEVRQDIADLARTVIANPSLISDEWNWLLTDDTYRGGERWVEILGLEDHGRIFAPTLEQLAKNSYRAKMWLSLYDLAYATANGDPDFIDQRLNEFVQRGSYDQAGDLLIRAPHSTNRLAMARELISAGHIPATSLEHFAFGTWGTIPAEAARDLASVALAATKDASPLVQYLASYLTGNPSAIETLRPLVLRVLGDASTSERARLDSYHWSELAKRVLPQDAVQVAGMTLRQVALHQTAYDGAFLEVLQAAWDAGDKKAVFTEVIAPWLEGNRAEAFWPVSVLRTIPIEEAGEDFLLTWVRANPKKRAYALADAAAPPHSPMSALQASLLAEFGELGVGGAFSARFMSGVFTGSHLEWSRSKLHQAEAWAADKRAAVRAWGEALVESLKDDVRRAEMRDAEERLLLRSE